MKLNNKTSQFETVTMGDPQGTILGPLLFILHINALLLDMPENTIALYADNTAEKRYKIKSVKSTKYLGLVFDSNMRWNEHILYVYNKT